MSASVSTCGDGHSSIASVNLSTSLINNNNNSCISTSAREDLEALEELARWNAHLNQVESKLFRFEQEIREKEFDLASTLDQCETILGKLEKIPEPDSSLPLDRSLHPDLQNQDEGRQMTQLDIEPESQETRSKSRVDTEISELLRSLHMPESKSEDSFRNQKFHPLHLLLESFVEEGLEDSISGVNNCYYSDNSGTGAGTGVGLPLSTIEKLQMEMRALKRQPRLFVSTKFNDEEARYLATESCVDSASSQHSLNNNGNCDRLDVGSSFDLDQVGRDSSENSGHGQENGLLCEFCGDLIPSFGFQIHQDICRRSWSTL